MEVDYFTELLGDGCKMVPVYDGALMELGQTAVLSFFLSFFLSLFLSSSMDKAGTWLPAHNLFCILSTISHRHSQVVWIIILF